MSTNFDTETGRWLVENGKAEFIKAGELTSAHVGRGLLHELWRDHKWDYIGGISKTKGGLIEIETLESAEPSKTESKEGNKTTVITEYPVKKVAQSFAPDVLICLSPFAGGEKVARPQARRVTEVTTKEVTVEPLAD